MPRPLDIGTNATARDVATLTRVLQRVTADAQHDPLEKKQIAEHLRATIELLVRWTEPVEGNGKNGARKEKASTQNRGLRAER